MLTLNKFDRLENFVDSLKKDIYPEPSTNKYFISEGIDEIAGKIKENSIILDVGCGQGYAVDAFKAMGANAIGITIDEVDKTMGVDKDNDIRMMDMSFLEFEDEYFDGLWARHSLEHSIFPYFTLSEWYRVLKQGGWIYIEVPAPNTDSKHETNMNHYSVFGRDMITHLISRIGFKNIKVQEITFRNEVGNDRYYRIIAEKGTNG